MSDHSSRSSSPPRIRIPVNLDGNHGHPSHPPARFLVSQSKEAEVHQSMLLAQLTDSLHRQGADGCPTSMMLNVGGVPVMAPHAAFSMTRAALTGPIPPHSQSMFTTQSAGVPILRGSGLVSLPPDMLGHSHRTSPQPPRLHVTGDMGMPTTIQGPMGSVVMLRVPSPARSPVSRTLARDPSPNPPKVIIEDTFSGPNSRPSPSSSLDRPSAFTKKQPTVVHCQDVRDIHSSRVSPNPPPRVLHNSTGKGPSGATLIAQRTTPEGVHRISPVPHRVSPGPPRRGPPAGATSKVPQTSLNVSHPGLHRMPHNPGVHGATPANIHKTLTVVQQQQHRASPTIQNRASPNIQHRASPNTQNRASPNVQSRASPNVQNRASPNIQNRVSPTPQYRVTPNVQYGSSTNVQHRASMSMQSDEPSNVQTRELTNIPHQRARDNMQYKVSLSSQYQRTSPPEHVREPLNVQHRTSPSDQQRPHSNSQYDRMPSRASPPVQLKQTPNVQHRTSLVEAELVKNRTSPNTQQHRIPYREGHQSVSHGGPGGVAVAPGPPIGRSTSSMNSLRTSPVAAHRVSPGPPGPRVAHTTSTLTGPPGPRVAHTNSTVTGPGPRVAHTTSTLTGPPGPRVVHTTSTVTGPPGPRLAHTTSTVTGPGPRVAHTTSTVTGPGPREAHTATTVIPASRDSYAADKRVPSDTRDGRIPEVHRNPFAAAMSSVRSQGSIREGSPSQQHQALLNMLVRNRPSKPHEIKLAEPVKEQVTDHVPSTLSKQELVVTATRTYHTGSSPANTSVVTAHGKPQHMIQPVREHTPQLHSRSSTQPILHKHLTTPISVSVEGPRDPASNPPALMPLLSSIMGLVPRPLFGDTAHPEDRQADDKSASLDTMPRLMPETLPNHHNGPGLLPPDRIKEEIDEKEEKKLIILDNPFNQRVKNLENFPATASSYKTTYRSQGMAIHRAKAGCIMNTARSLDMLRHNLQKFINKEIDMVIQRYVEEFFKPGIDNIRVNNGTNAVSDDHMAAVCRQILEEAKRMYMSGSRCNTPDNVQDNVSESGSLAPPENKTVRDKKLDLFKIKKRRGSSDSEASVTKKKRKGRPPLRAGNGRSTPLKTGKNDPVRKEGPKWDPERLTTEVKFVMGARANKALGLGAQRGRIYIKHPELFKYAGDQDDKNWLHENHHMPATGGKAYLLLVDDIMDMAASDEYKNNPGLMLGEIIGFCVPQWMVQKMKEQMQSLRTDVLKPGKPKPSTLPLQGQLEMTLPFSAQKPPSVTDSRSDLQPSPSATDTMEVMSTCPDDDTPVVSPYNMSGGFVDTGPTPEVSPSPSNDHEETDEYEDDGPLTAPFQT